MTLDSVKEHKKEACAELKELSPKAEDLVNEVRTKVAKAIEANNLCYNCETGFHYMKQ